MLVKRNCDNCGEEYKADTRNLKRGWGLCCSKSCAATKREKSKPGYNPERVERNNVRRVLWNENKTLENFRNENKTLENFREGDEYEGLENLSGDALGQWVD